ncbi:MAG: hypothetical protein WCG27_05140, partial [Pseudomonadota bacterium]
MRGKFLKTVIIYACSIQMLLVGFPIPAFGAETYRLNYPQLIKEMKIFQEQLLGREELPAKKVSNLVEIEKTGQEADGNDDFSALEEKILKEFNALVAEKRKDPRGEKEQRQLWQEEFSTACQGQCRLEQKENARDETAEKPAKHIPGVIEQWAAEVLEQEKNKQTLVGLGNTDPVVITYFNRAKVFRDELRKYLFDDSINDEQKRDLLLKYVDQVLWPTRELVTVRRAYNGAEAEGNYFYHELLNHLEFPTDLFPAAEKKGDPIPYLRSQLVIGNAQQGKQNYLRIDDGFFNKSQLYFEEGQAIQRDLMALMRVPTARNYLQAIRWITIQMMTSQIFLYDKLMGKGDDTTIVPTSCQKHFYGNMPEHIHMKLGQDPNLFLENILQEQGLISDPVHQPQIDEYYLNIHKADPTRNVYRGTIPFEDYKNAVKGLESFGKEWQYSPSVLPDFDDLEHYTKAIDLKVGKALLVFQGKIKDLPVLQQQRLFTQYTNTVKQTGEGPRTFVYEGMEMFKKIYTPAKGRFGIWVGDNEKPTEVSSEVQNLSEYLAEMMALHRFT